MIDFKNKIILGVGAHPDDLDFACGATIAKAGQAGAKIYYLIATGGQRGSSDSLMTAGRLARTRKEEQRGASKILGVSEVYFLNYNDGELKANLELKEKIVVYIRKLKPDYVFTMDPSNFFYKRAGFVNHTDHRAIGQAALDASYPLARDWLSFPEHQRRGLKPHKVKEIFFPAFEVEQANFFYDTSPTFEQKIQAIKFHLSQVGDLNELERRMRQRAGELGEIIGVKYAEAFIRLKLR